MKLPLQALLFVGALLVACRQRDNAVWAGFNGFKFNGIELELPNDGKGKYRTSADELEYQWDGKVVTIRDLGNETVSVTTPVVRGQVVKKSLVIMIDSAGALSTRVAEGDSQTSKPEHGDALGGIRPGGPHP